MQVRQSADASNHALGAFGPGADILAPGVPRASRAKGSWVSGAGLLLLLVHLRENAGKGPSPTRRTRRRSAWTPRSAPNPPTRCASPTPPPGAGTVPAQHHLPVQVSVATLRAGRRRHHPPGQALGRRHRDCRTGNRVAGQAATPSDRFSPVVYRRAKLIGFQPLSTRSFLGMDSREYPLPMRERVV